MDISSDYALPPRAASPLRLKLFLGLSRTPHGLLDAATPAMGALLCLGHFPPVRVMLVGLVAAFAGYTAVYALNDLVDFRIDRERLSLRDHKSDPFDVDAVMVPHPVAQGLLPFSYGLAWCLFWAAVAVAGALWLNPVCAVLFGISACMEIVYCKLLRITHLKIVPSAIVKATGGLAGVYAVYPSPPPGFVAVLFIWLAAWEVGGQNIANDIVDMVDDAKVAANTTLTVKGMRESVFRMLCAISAAVVAGVAIYWLAGPGVGKIYPVGAALLGWILLIKPAREVYYDQGPSAAAALFNRASYMPVAFLVLCAVAIAAPL